MRCYVYKYLRYAIINHSSLTAHVNVTGDQPKSIRIQNRVRIRIAVPV